MGYTIMTNAAAKQNKKKTIEDLTALPEGTRSELVDGEIYMMAPAQAKHSEIQSYLSQKLRTKYPKDNFSNGDDGWWIISEIWTHYEQHESYVHDLAGFKCSKLKSLPEKGPIKVKPEWVCEILSPSNWQNDTHRKRCTLEAHKVPYYWIIDPERKSIQVFHLPPKSSHYQILSYLSSDDGKIKIDPFPDLELDLAELFAN